MSCVSRQAPGLRKGSRPIGLNGYKPTLSMIRADGQLQRRSVGTLAWLTAPSPACRRVSRGKASTGRGFAKNRKSKCCREKYRGFRDVIERRSQALGLDRARTVSPRFIWRRSAEGCGSSIYHQEDCPPGPDGFP